MLPPGDIKCQHTTQEGVGNATQFHANIAVANANIAVSVRQSAAAGNQVHPVKGGLHAIAQVL